MYVMYVHCILICWNSLNLYFDSLFNDWTGSTWTLCRLYIHFPVHNRGGRLLIGHTLLLHYQVWNVALRSGSTLEEDKDEGRLDDDTKARLRQRITEVHKNTDTQSLAFWKRYLTITGLISMILMHLHYNDLHKCECISIHQFHLIFK